MIETGTFESPSSILSRLVESYFGLFLYDTATFYAERLHYENPSNQSLNLLAQCYFRQGKMKQTCLILKDSDWPDNRYLYALACLSLPAPKLSDAERVLSPSIDMNPQDFTTEMINKVPKGSAGLYLLGNICRRGHRLDAAASYYKWSLKVCIIFNIRILNNFINLYVG
jgi:tetratricopeptide (TPR) repeat protein